MKDQILRLCKRMEKFTFDDILLISEIDSEILKPILNELITDNKLKLNNGYYKFVNGAKIEKPKPSVMKYYPIDILDTVLRCYCADITSLQASLVIGLYHNQILKIYKYFRSEIYNRQFEELEKQYLNKPQFAKHPTFMEQKATLYMYNHQVYVAEVPFKSKKNRLAKNDNAEYKKIYCYLKRAINHNSMSVNMHHKIAEAIWKRNKSFEERYSDLKYLIF